MKPLFISVLFAGLVPSLLFGQAPVIQNIDPLNASPNDTIVITGSGFNNTPANLDVWFGPVRGTVISSSEYAVEVRVPAQSALRTIEVVNRVTRLSAKSNLKFTPSLKMQSFNTANFAAPVAFTATEDVWDLCSCDLNADGKPDLAATKFTGGLSGYTTSTDIMVLQNNSTPGNLTAASFNKLDKTNFPVFNLTFGTDHIVCGDLQGDGYPELVVSRAGSTRNSIHIFRNTTVGTTLSFTLVAPLLLDNSHFATRMDLRDLNRDGKPEIIVTNSFNDQLYVFINQSSAGTLSFNPIPVKLSIKIDTDDDLTTYEVHVDDLNGDNLPDIIINQFQTNDLYILRNQSTGDINFAAPQKISLLGGLNRLTTADLNSDGKLDLAVTSTLDNQVDILLNETANGASSFTFAPSISMITANGPWGVDVSDIDGDNDADIIIASRDAQNIINVFLNNGNPTPAFTKTDVNLNLPTRNIKVGDLDGDGKADFAYTAFNTTNPTTKVNELGIMRNTHCHQPEIENAESLVICNGQTIQLTTAPADNVTFLWTKDGGAVGDNNPYLNITTPGTYKVTAVGEGGACSVPSDEVIVTADLASAPPKPVITANTPLCIGATLNLSSDVVGDTYIWTGPNGFSASIQNPSIPLVTDDHAGIYSLQVQTGVCKSEVATKRVDVARLADFTITSNNATNTVCDGNSVSLSVNNPPGHTFQWLKDGVNITTEVTHLLSASQQGIYSVKVKNNLLNCETETAGTTITVLTPPVAAYAADLSGCTTSEHIFTNESSADTRATPVTNWGFGDGFTATTENATHLYATAQNFNASLTVSYQGLAGCSDVETKVINIISGTQPSISGAAASACPEELVTLSVTGTFASTVWSNAATESTISVIPGTYTVNTVDANGCPGLDEFIIVAKEVPQLVISEPVTIAAGESTQLTASGAVSYTWSPVETLDDPMLSNPKASPLETTMYTVIGRSIDDCEAATEVLITVRQGLASFPVAFSPNGDGDNDTWEVGAINNPDCTLSVFDGRGRRIFENKGENWNGTYQGTPVPDGTYYFVFGCPDQKPLTGSVLVFK